MQVEVISLGGSVFLQDEIDVDYLKKFKKLILSMKTRKFVIVTGGGKVARVYIDALRKGGLPDRMLSNAGIAITRINAKFLANFFMGKQQHSLPRTLGDVKRLLAKHRVVFSGGLRYEKGGTSDSTAAEIARYLNTRFINMMNVKGLYTHNPMTSKNAKFISSISYADFLDRALKIKYAAGQHFVLDVRAAEVIQRGKVPTYIIGRRLNNLKSLLQGKPFVGTTIR
jgi:uridylate kinase